MPIRFRCAYCNQLMGIARRKAGTVVRCPTCGGQLVVPHPSEGEEPEPEGPGDQPGDPLVFERNDFDELLDSAADRARPETIPAPPSAPPAPSPAAPAQARGQPIPPSFQASPVSAPPGASPPARPGLVLSPTQATILSVAVIVLVALAFVLGLLLGVALRSR